MTQQQNPLERAVDLLVFAPIGVAMFAKDTVPTFMKMFVSRGQTEIQHRKKSLHDQANQYRAVGKFAVKHGGPEVKRQAESKLGQAARRAEETFTGLKVSRGSDTDAAPAKVKPTEPAARVKVEQPAKPAPDATPPKVTKVEAAKIESAAARSGTVANGASIVGAPNGQGAGGEKKNGKAASVHNAAALAIPEYDMLSASQVVERLDGLTPEELDAVRTYELAHRGRSTILGKITQLTT